MLKFLKINKNEKRLFNFDYYSGLSGTYCFSVVLWGTKVYNGMVTMQETVTSQWGNVETAYQRRSDLIPNFVNTVKGAANFEQTTLTQVIEARAKATSVTIDPTKMTAANMQQFQQAQGQLIFCTLKANGCC